MNWQRGTRSIRWDYADDQQILLNWQEALTDVTQSAAPAGFGSMLLELAARQLGEDNRRPRGRPMD